MPKWIALLLPSLAQSLALSRGHAITDSTNDGDDLCDAEALHKAREVGNDWKALKGNPCMSEADYKDLESGTRDPDDNFEFLGDDDMEELVDINVVPSEVKMSDSQGYPTMFPKVQFLGYPHTGSTTLAQQMHLHPELSFGLTKEHKMIFNLGKVSNAILKKVYQSSFPLRNGSNVQDADAKYTFDASPDTIFIGCPDDEKIKQFPIGKKYGTGVKAVHQVKNFFGSDTKYIVMLRDPIDWMTSEVGGAPDLDHMLGNNNNPSLDATRSCYADCLEAWVQVVGKHNILFLDSESYFKDPQTTLNKVFKFIGVKPMKLTKEDLGIQSGRRRAANQESSFPASDRKLYWQDSRVKECKARLTKLTGRGWHWGH